jgi:adenylate cyclase
MGDGLMAIFNFPIRIADHASAAIMAARDIQEHCTEALDSLKSNLDGLPDHLLGVGVGIHTGDVEIGEFSSFRSDFTAIGGAVNLAARLDSQAGVGEILISPATAALATELAAGTEARMLQLKGIEHQVAAQVLLKR